MKTLTVFLAFSIVLPGFGQMALTNAVLDGSATFRSTGDTNWLMTLDRGTVWMPPAHFGGPYSSESGGLYWTKDGRPAPYTSGEGGWEGMGKIVCFDNWGSMPGANTLLLASRNLRLENGWFGEGGYISIGNEDQIDGVICINYTPLKTNAARTDLAYYGEAGLPNETGVGIPLAFAVHACDVKGNNFYCYPGIQSHGTPQGDGSVTYGISGDTRGLGELWFYSGVPISVGAPDYFDGCPGVVVGRMLTNGWDLRGKIIRERVASSATSGSVGLSFASGYCVDIVLGTSAASFYTTNATGLARNYEPRIFILRAGRRDVACTWPNGWSWTTTAPKVITNRTLVRLQLESLGPGETNIIASAVSAADKSPRAESSAEDTDGDGIPDSWEQAYGLDPNTSADAIEDPDHDGITNLRECQLGLSPRAADLPVLITQPLVNGPGPVFVVQKMYGRAGTVQVSTNLIDWERFLDLPATNTDGYFTDFSVTNSERRFYRVQLQ